MSWARGQASAVKTKPRDEVGGAQLVLFGLADRCDTHGITYVGQATLAADCSISERTVRENLVRLERRGLIKRIRRTDGRGWRTSDYIVVGPLMVDRRGMADAPDEAFETGRYPEDVVLFARECDDRAWAREMLAQPATVAGRQAPDPTESVHLQEALPATDAEPTGESRHPNRQLSPSQPATVAGEQLVESSLGIQQEASWLPPPRADVDAAADPGEGGRELPAEDEDEAPTPNSYAGSLSQENRLRLLRWSGEHVFSDALEVGLGDVEHIAIDDLVGAFPAGSDPSRTSPLPGEVAAA